MTDCGWAPTIEQGETLYSWCATVHRLSGNRSSARTASAVTGVAHAARYHEVPPSLSKLRQVMAEIRTEMDMVREHTTVGFYFPFAPREPGGGASIRLHGKRRLTGVSRTLTFRTPLRWCSSCCEEDRLAVGRSYWHVLHQLPGVLTCPEHGAALNCLRPTGKCWLLPDEINPEYAACDQAGIDAAQTLTAVTAAAFKEQQLDASALRAAAVYTLREQGVITSQSRTSHASLEDWFVASSTGKLCGNQATGLSRLASGSWIAPMLWRQRRSHALLWVVLWSALCPTGSLAARRFSDAGRGRIASQNGQYLLPFKDLVSTTPPHLKGVALSACTYRQACAANGVSFGSLGAWLEKDFKLREIRKVQSNERRVDRMNRLIAKQGVAALTEADKRWIKLHDVACFSQLALSGRQLPLF